MKTIYLATAYSYRSILAKVPTNPPAKFDVIGRYMMWLRNQRVTKVAAKLMTKGYNVFSPITHSHVIARIGKLPALDHEFWLKLDEWYVRRCDMVWVYNQPGWSRSIGVNREMDWAWEDGKAVYTCNSNGEILSCWMCREEMEFDIKHFGYDKE